MEESPCTGRSATLLAPSLTSTRTKMWKKVWYSSLLKTVGSGYPYDAGSCISAVNGSFTCVQVFIAGAKDKKARTGTT